MLNIPPDVKKKHKLHHVSGYADTVNIFYMYIHCFCRCSLWPKLDAHSQDLMMCFQYCVLRHLQVLQSCSEGLNLIEVLWSPQVQTSVTSRNERLLVNDYLD